jgi:hypothetical protein
MTTTLAERCAALDPPHVCAFKVHPFADKFPMIEGEAFDSLVKSLTLNGLREKITLTPDGTAIVDGRNRYLACIVATVDVSTERLPADLYADDETVARYIIDKNLERRHLTAGQRDFLALAYKEMYAKEAKEAQQEAGRHYGKGHPKVGADLRQAMREPKAAERAAKAVGASGRGVQQAQKIRNADPGLAAKVQAGTVAIDAAYKTVQARKRAQPEPPTPRPWPPPVGLSIKDFAGAVQDKQILLGSLAVFEGDTRTFEIERAILVMESAELELAEKDARAIHLWLDCLIAAITSHKAKATKAAPEAKPAPKAAAKAAAKPESPKAPPRFEVIHEGPHSPNFGIYDNKTKLVGDQSGTRAEMDKEAKRLNAGKPAPSKAAAKAVAKKPESPKAGRAKPRRANAKPAPKKRPKAP